MSLGAFMAATRRLESGSFRGNYSAIGRAVKGDRARGAYQIMSKNWPSWSRAAGLAGADWRDPAAQDAVAKHVMQKYFRRYGNWDLVAVAWYAGQSSADKVARRGYEGPDSIQNRHIRGYVNKIKQYLADPEVAQFGTPGMRGEAPPGSWVFPVAGESQWSKGSYMPTTKTHRGRYHAAVDIYAGAGTPVVSPVAGTVQNMGSGKIGGNFVQIRGADGNLYYFAHLKDHGNIKRGQQINAGHHLGSVGNTGSASSTKPHLHFSIRNPQGKQVSPISFLNSAYQMSGVFTGMDTKGMGQAGGSSFVLGMHDLIRRSADEIAGGERIDYRTLTGEQPEDETVVEQVAESAGEPMQRKTAKQLSKGDAREFEEIQR